MQQDGHNGRNFSDNDETNCTMDETIDIEDTDEYDNNH